MRYAVVFEKSESSFGAYVPICPVAPPSARRSQKSKRSSPKR